MPGPPWSVETALLSNAEPRRKEKQGRNQQGDVKTPDVALQGQSSLFLLL